MTRNEKLARAICLLALGLSAVGSGGTPGQSMRIRDETAPAGGVVQMKVSTTEVTPISGGRPHLNFDTAFFERVDGIGLFAPTGELAGAAVIDGDHVSIAYVTTTPFTGDYPLLTVALRIRPDVPAGTRTLFTLNPSSLWTLNGRPVATRVSPATVTAGGSVAVSSVSPGEGWFPAGTVVSVRGVGFNGQTRVRLEDTNITGERVVSATEIRFTLAEAATMTAARVRVDNPDGSRVIYYSYLHGLPAATSSRALLVATQPIFSGTTRSVATVGPIPATNSMQYFALALQNPGLAGADVTVALYAADGTLLQSSARPLDSGYRLLLELSELFDGVAPPPGAFVRVISSAPIETLGALCDEAAWTVTPRLPAEAGAAR
jgi:hypothetical protein